MDEYQRQMILNQFRDYMGEEEYDVHVKVFGEDSLIQMAIDNANKVRRKKEKEEQKRKNRAGRVKWIFLIPVLLHGVLLFFSFFNNEQLADYHYIIGFFTIPFGSFGVLYLFLDINAFKGDDGDKLLGKILMTIITIIGWIILIIKLR